jgi:hypothetical protein
VVSHSVAQERDPPAASVAGVLCSVAQERDPPAASQYAFAARDFQYAIHLWKSDGGYVAGAQKKWM